MKLKKAFRFASWSSIGLVSILFLPEIGYITNQIITIVVCHPHSTYSIPVIRLVTDIRCQRLDCMGLCRDCVDVPLEFHGRVIPVV